MNRPPGILHPFNPALLHHVHHDEVRFVHGRYLDIASQKGKDRNSLYFGTSKNSGALAGIFLGDQELTSKVKDVSIKAEGKNVVLMVKYVNDKGKLTTIKATLPTTTSIDQLDGLGEELLKRVKILDTSVNLLTNRVTATEQKVNSIEQRVDRQDTSINGLYTDLDSLYTDLENGKYRYRVKESTGEASDGAPIIYSLHKGNNADSESDQVILHDYILKSLEYDSSSNALIAKTWPKNADSSDTLKTEHVFNTSVNLDELRANFAEYINNNSEVNERITVLEQRLAWESLLNG